MMIPHRRILTGRREEADQTHQAYVREPLGLKLKSVNLLRRYISSLLCFSAFIIIYCAGDDSFFKSSIFCIATGVVPSQTPLCTSLSFSHHWTGDVSIFPVRASTPSSVTSSVCSNCADRFPSVVVAVQSSGHERHWAVPSQIMGSIVKVCPGAIRPFGSELR